MNIPDLTAHLLQFKKRIIAFATLDLAADDYVEIAVYQNSGGNINIDDTEATNNVTIAKVS